MIIPWNLKKLFFALFFYFHLFLSSNLRVAISIYTDFIKFYQSIQQRCRWRHAYFLSTNARHVFYVKVADFIIYHAILYFLCFHSDVMLIKAFEIKLHTVGRWNIVFKVFLLNLAIYLNFKIEKSIKLIKIWVF